MSKIGDGMRIGSKIAGLSIGAVLIKKLFQHDAHPWVARMAERGLGHVGDKRVQAATEWALKHGKGPAMDVADAGAAYAVGAYRELPSVIGAEIRHGVRGFTQGWMGRIGQAVENFAMNAGSRR